jgi:hypothetical protein
MKRRLRLPVPPPPTPSLEGFVLVARDILPAVTPEEAARQQELYQWALKEAQAVVGPSILERDLLAAWN